MLANNVVRINGYKNGKRTHVDITVVMKKVEYFSNKQKFEVEVPNVPHFERIPWLGFENGLEGVTSYNYYNWVAQKRMTEKCQ